MLDYGKGTVYRISVVWAILLEILFGQLNFKPSEGYLLKITRYICKNRNYGVPDMFIDCMEFKSQHTTNLNLNSLMLSSCKKTVAGKALIGISPHRQDFYLAIFFLIQ